MYPLEIAIATWIKWPHHAIEREPIIAPLWKFSRRFMASMYARKSLMICEELSNDICKATWKVWNVSSLERKCRLPRAIQKTADSSQSMERL